MSRGRHLLPTEHSRLMTSCKLREVLLDLDAEIPLRIFDRAKRHQRSEESEDARAACVALRGSPHRPCRSTEPCLDTDLRPIAPRVEAARSRGDEAVAVVSFQALNRAVDVIGHRYLQNSMWI